MKRKKKIHIISQIYQHRYFLKGEITISQAKKLNKIKDVYCDSISKNGVSKRVKYLSIGCLFGYDSIKDAIFAAKKFKRSFKSILIFESLVPSSNLHRETVS